MICMIWYDSLYIMIILTLTCTYNTKRYDMNWYDQYYFTKKMCFLCIHSLGLTHWYSANTDVAIQADSEDSQCRLHGCRRVSWDRPVSSTRMNGWVQFHDFAVQSQWDTGLPWHHCTCPHHESGNSIWVKGWVAKTLQGFANSGVFHG